MNFNYNAIRKRCGFFVERDEKLTDVTLKQGDENTLYGNQGEFNFQLEYVEKENGLEIQLRIENLGEDSSLKIGFHTGIDSYMESYPQWHESYFPTMLRCEKTHLWGYYMNTIEEAIMIATKAPVASYDIVYNKKTNNIWGHRIIGTDIVFFQNTPLPERHPQNLKIFHKGQVYENKILLSYVTQKDEIKKTISKIGEIPVIHAEKYTLEKGEVLKYELFCEKYCDTTTYLPDSTVVAERDIVLEQEGLYRVVATAENGKQCEASFFVRKDWDWYLKASAENALLKPQKASTHCESFYGMFSCFLEYKHSHDETLGAKAIAMFEEIFPYMFDFNQCTPILIPDRIQNTSSLVSILVDIYESNKEKYIKYLKYASVFGDFLMKKQDKDGVYRNKNVHYTCVIYIAKSMLELVCAEKDCEDEELQRKGQVHYQSVKQAVDELVCSLDNIETEGEITLEDGMISCSALQIGMFALTLPVEKRKPYIKAAEYMMKTHACLEQQLIPDCRMNGASLRYWESQYDVMIRKNMMNSPHGWTGWTGYAHYYLYLLTGKKTYLLSLMNLMGSCAQLVDEDGNLRWGFCSQPYLKAQTLVPDMEQEIADGYKFVDVPNKAYRGKYVECEFTEQYIDMISDWYRTGEQKVTGGYDFCPLIFDERVEYVDNQGGCCDNDVHEIFKCMEETVLKKAFLHENEDGSLLCFGCSVQSQDGQSILTIGQSVKQLVCNVGDAYKEMLEGIQKQKPELTLIDCISASI